MIAAADLRPDVAMAFRTVLDRYRAALVRYGDPPVGHGVGVVEMESPLCEAARHGRARCGLCPLGPRVLGCARGRFLDSLFATHATRDDLARRYFALRARASVIGFVVRHTIQAVQP